ncbi:MAG: 50S ribosomal protein L11 methyltransferase [Pseudomonadota bacterium]
MPIKNTYRAVIEVDSQALEIATYALFELGSLGSIEEDCETKGKIRLIAFFNSNQYKKPELRDIICASFTRFPELSNACVEVALEPAKDWNAKWREHFKPFPIAKGVVVVPSWEKYVKKPDEVVISLDPGMAFGTGLHETTRLCAQALLSAINYRPTTHLSLLDVGTGSGILSIIANKLNIQNLIAVDNDPDALRIARKNLEINGCSGTTILDNLNEVSGNFDIVIANILLSTLIALKGALTTRVAQGGILILSGITLDQEQEIFDAYSDAFDIVDTQRKGEWSCIQMEKASNPSTSLRAGASKASKV